MQASARILLLSPEGVETGLDTRLIEQGYPTIQVKERAEALRRLANEQADVAIVEGGPEAAERLRQDIDVLTHRQRFPVIAISDQAGNDKTHVDIDIMAPPFADAELFRRLDSLGRLVTMQDELYRRSATNAEYTAKSAAIGTVAEDSGEPRILTIPASEKDIALSHKALDRNAMLAVCEDPADAPARLMRGDFDALILAVGDDAQDSLYLCSDLRSNPRLYNTPVLMIADKAAFERPQAPYEAGASDVIYRPVSPEQLRFRCQRLVSQHRYRLAMQKVLSACRDNENQDILTGLYNHGYLHAHLERMMGAARGNGKALTVGVFEIANMAALNKDVGYAAADRLLRQVGALIRGLVRVEDLPARLDGRRFAVVLPDTPLEAATPVLHRLAGVVNHTEFALADGETSIRIALNTGSAQMSDEKRASVLLARAAENLGN